MANYIDDPRGISGSKYDAARVILGDGWRIPTLDEWQRLRDECTWTFKTKNGKRGVTVSNGTKSIFLPTASLIDRNGLNDDMYTVGDYRTSNLSESWRCYNVVVDFLDQYTLVVDRARCEGCVIRPVSDEEKPNSVQMFENGVWWSMANLDEDALCVSETDFGAYFAFGEVVRKDAYNDETYTLVSSYKKYGVPGDDLLAEEYEEYPLPEEDGDNGDDDNNLISFRRLKEYHEIVKAAISQGGKIEDVKVNDESIVNEEREAVISQAEPDALASRILGQSTSGVQISNYTDDIDDPDETKVPTIKATHALGKVKTLNNEEPDENGNIDIKVLDTVRGDGVSYADGIQSTRFDAASIILGSEWRMPTKAEFDELLEKCAVGSIAGVNKITSSETGNSLVINPSTRGFWLSDNIDNDKAYATNGITAPEKMDRYNGLNIRPVTTNEAFGVDMGTSVRWADRYIGAIEEKAEGFLFAFGEIAPKYEFSWEAYMCRQDECGTDVDPIYGGTNERVNHTTNSESHLTNEERRYIYDRINQGGNNGIEKVYWADETHTRLIMKLK